MDYEAVINGDGKYIDIHIAGFTIRTDQFKEKAIIGENPTPGKLLYAAVASCALSTACGYCTNNDLPLPTGMRVHVEGDIESIQFEIDLPADFPEDRIEALRRATNACWVKKQWLNPPDFKTTFARK